MKKHSLSAEQQQRLKSLIKKTLPILALLVGYYIFVRLTGLGIPCPFYSLTGKQCPGCGISRMFMALMRFDLAAAASYNLFVLCLLPFGLFLFIYKSIVYIRKGATKTPMWENVFYIVVFVLCVIFTIWRNTPSYIF
ncbi:MAG: DUF2752 domain-containing protein [Ruminococcus sp.]|nr:DUF2752 domain-containing protein [Ruminococcus sp.]